MDHLTWLMEIQNLQNPEEDLPRLTRVSLPDRKTEEKTTTQYEVVSGIRDVSALAERLNQAESVPWQASSPGQTASVFEKQQVFASERNSTVTAFGETQTPAPMAAAGGISMEEISRFFERDARRFG